MAAHWVQTSPTPTNTYWAGEKLGGYSTLVGRTVTSEFGRGLDTSFDGRRVIGGAPGWGPNTSAGWRGQNRGYVEIFDYNAANDTWGTIPGGYIESPDTTTGQVGTQAADARSRLPDDDKIYQAVGGGGLFGESVSMNWDGDRIVVGAPGINKVYVYDYNGTSWGTPQTISAASGITSFGHCVSLCGDKGDRFAVGAPEENKVYVYERLGTATSFTLAYTDNGSSLTNSLPLSTSGNITLNSDYNGYGYHVKMSDFGDHMVVGAPGTHISNLNSNMHSGTANYYTMCWAIGDAGAVNSYHPHRAVRYSTNSIINSSTTSATFIADRYSGGDPIGGFGFRTPQIGQVRIMKCTPDTSWSTPNAVTQMGNLIPGYDAGIVKVDTFDNNASSSFGGFGTTVQINPEGTRIAVGSPFYKFSTPPDDQSRHGRVDVFDYDSITNTWVNSYPAGTLASENGCMVGQVAMASDGSRIFLGGVHSAFITTTFDYTGKDWFQTEPFIISGGDINEIGGTGHLPSIIAGAHHYQNYRNVCKSGELNFVSVPGYNNTGGYPHGSYVTARGLILVYKHTLTSLFNGNSLFEGFVKCNELAIGGASNGTKTQRLAFGGVTGDDFESATTIETRYLGFESTATTGHQSELIISKWSTNPMSSSITGQPSMQSHPYGNVTGLQTSADPNRVTKETSGDRIRLKAPKIEFHLTAPGDWSGFSKYREAPVMTLVSTENWPYLVEQNNLAANPNPAMRLVNIRTCHSESNVHAGLRLTASNAAGYKLTGRFNQDRMTPDDGNEYTFSPDNHGWLHLLSGQSGQANMYGTHAGLKVGHLYAAGSTRYSSDDRLKHFEEEIPNCLELIKQVKPYKYKKTIKMYTEDYTGEIGTEDKDWYWEIGFIAQDIEKIPYLEFAVSKPENDTEGKYALNYTHFIGVCLQGIKDLHNRHQPEIAKVATLQSDLTIEKEKVATLQTDLTTLQSDVSVEKEKVATLQSDVAIEKEKVATLQTDVAVEKEKVATLQTDVDREKLKTLNLQERILVMEQAYHALLERVSDLENS